MGADNFEVFKIGRFKTVNEAFEFAVEDALYEHGHDSYNGTISTTSFCGTEKAPRYGTKAFEHWIAKRLETVDKWDCYAVEITGAVLKRLKATHGLKGRKGIRAFVFYGVAAC
jgi:hypothetical protein